MKEEEVNVLPHGNALKRTRPYIRTWEITWEITWETVTKVPDFNLEEPGGPFKSTSQCQGPRDKKQVHN